MQHRSILACILGLMMTQSLFANNITVSNVTITDQDSVTKTANIVFDLNWENSWRLSTGPANWDAAWVFVKYHNGDGVWRHAKLLTTAVSHSVPTGASLSLGVTGSNGMGAFIHRSAAGAGTVAWNGIKLKWNYGADNILDSALITADVQAIEMVYVPEGTYYLGDSISGAWCRGDSQGSPYPVTSAQGIQLGNTAGEMLPFRWGGSGAGTPGVNSTGIIPPEYPNGYAAFYSMKYEVSQGQFARYLNTGGSSVTSFYQFTGTSIRQSSTGTAPNVTANTPERAYISGSSTNSDILYYLNWAGLRPMSEFEFEKACRGPVYPVPGEFAWGTAVVASLPYTLSGDGTDAEAVSANYTENAGNAWYPATRGSLVGPCRVGMFAKASYAGSTSPRIQSGSSYWGILDLTGNALELVAPAAGASLFAGTPTTGLENYIQFGGAYYSYSSSNFRGSHGIGANTQILDWGTAGGGGGTLKGGSWGNSLALSTQGVSSAPVSLGLTSERGIRGARTAP